MSTMNENLKKKTFGIMKSIETMNTKERQQKPSEDFGKNYNNLRQIVIENNQELASLLPPAVKIADYGFEGYVDMRTEHSYSEIHAFCSEIYHLLS